MLTFRRKRELKQAQRRVLIDSIKIGLASPMQIKNWGERELPNGKKIGKVTTPKTVDYKALKPVKDGLFCERIFGPVKDNVCACGKQQGGNKGRFCTECEVEWTTCRTRRYRLGYIDLASPVTHVWYIKGRPNYIATLLGTKPRLVEGIAYCTKFVLGAAVIGGPNEVSESGTVAENNSPFLQFIQPPLPVLAIQASQETSSAVAFTGKDIPIIALDSSLNSFWGRGPSQSDKRISPKSLRIATRQSIFSVNLQSISGRKPLKRTLLPRKWRTGAVNILVSGDSGTETSSMNHYVVQRFDHPFLTKTEKGWRSKGAMELTSEAQTDALNVSSLELVTSRPNFQIEEKPSPYFSDTYLYNGQLGRYRKNQTLPISFVFARDPDERSQLLEFVYSWGKEKDFPLPLYTLSHFSGNRAASSFVSTPSMVRGGPFPSLSKTDQRTPSFIHFDEKWKGGGLRTPHKSPAWGNALKLIHSKSPQELSLVNTSTSQHGVGVDSWRFKDRRLFLLPAKVKRSQQTSAPLIQRYQEVRKNNQFDLLSSSSLFASQSLLFQGVGRSPLAIEGVAPANEGVQDLSSVKERRYLPLRWPGVRWPPPLHF